MIAIETNDLKKAYGKTAVLKGISLQIKKGEIFGFLGRNGAGKSTFINIMTGIANQSSGSFSILGAGGHRNETKKKIGVMPDYSTFYENLSAVDHLRFFSDLSGNPASKEQCIEVLKSVGLHEHVRKKTKKYSFGMKKKLGIAQAIIHDPELLFLDEPTSGLDAESVIHIQKLIFSLQKQGKTIFMTSHNLDEVEKICTRVAIMREGLIIKCGTMDELKSFYRSTMIVKMKHSPISPSGRETLKKWLKGAGTDLIMKDQSLSITVSSEKKIAEIIRALNQSKVDVYGVHVEEPSLQDIFMEA
ncbi:ABC transporter ATP-binding protein [Jeotgalibacillus sp. ET6]|uniref:ABC transporter ATP-binding protein n=1 Tax=Jeotgalibacillus sp. ET6 TaxID=3037260 RepID=UPI0024189B12|nr:ABC transporter ATP-binding protein [Jeotgalibacillus sp. ET6]MDG5472118.1 ABC transporter ATP-binding protein [Jeotgalibacillus sp. ET6]